MLHISDTVNSLDTLTQENASMAEKTNKISKDIGLISQGIVLNVEKSLFN